VLLVWNNYVKIYVTYNNMISYIKENTNLKWIKNNTNIIEEKMMKLWKHISIGFVVEDGEDVK